MNVWMVWQHAQEYIVWVYVSNVVISSWILAFNWPRFLNSLLQSLTMDNALRAVNYSEERDSWKAHWPSGLRRRSEAETCWDCGFEPRKGYGCLSLVSVVSCQVQVSATGRSIVQRHRLWRAIFCDLETSRTRRPWPELGCWAKKEDKEFMGLCKILKVFGNRGLGVTFGGKGEEVTGTERNYIMRSFITFADQKILLQWSNNTECDKLGR